MAIILDITNWKQRGQELHQLISDECGYQNRRGMIGTLPDVIRMTPNQFDDLCKVMNFPAILGSKDRLFKTTYNVMEVEVVNHGLII